MLDRCHHTYIIEFWDYVYRLILFAWINLTPVSRTYFIGLMFGSDMRIRGKGVVWVMQCPIPTSNIEPVSFLG